MAEQVVFGAHQSNSEAGQLLSTFWPRITNEVRTKPLQVSKSGSKKDEPIQELPLARIKKIMKQDGDVKMISAEAPILFSKAAEIFISELSLRAWIHTEDNKRRTLQRNDIAMAITKYDQFDFLIDIVPRDELKPAKRQEETIRQPTNVMAPEQVQYYFQLSNLQQQAGAAATPATTSGAPQTPQITQLPPGAHIIQQANGQVIIAAQPHQIAALAGAGAGAVPGQQAQIVQIPNTGESSATDQQQENTQQVSQNNSLLQSSNESQSTSQVQFAPGQQIHYVRIPQNGTSGAATNLSQVVGLQQQQLHQPSAGVPSSNTNHTQQQQQQDVAYSQIYQPISTGVPGGTVYVLADPNSSQNDITQTQE